MKLWSLVNLFIMKLAALLSQWERPQIRLLVHFCFNSCITRQPLPTLRGSLQRLLDTNYFVRINLLFFKKKIPTMIGLSLIKDRALTDWFLPRRYVVGCHWDPHRWFTVSGFSVIHHLVVTFNTIDGMEVRTARYLPVVLI